MGRHRRAKQPFDAVNVMPKPTRFLEAP